MSKLNVARNVLMGAALIGVLAGCGAQETPQEALVKLCGEAISGEEALDQMPDGVTVDAVCACYGQSAATKGEDVMKVQMEVLGAINTVRESEGVDVEAAASLIMETLETDASAYPFKEKAFEAVGEFLSDSMDSLEDGGTCAVPAN
jgi:hypothetical protein